MLQSRVIKHVCLALKQKTHASHHSSKNDIFVATQKTYGVEQRVFIMRKSVELFWTVGVHTQICEGRCEQLLQQSVVDGFYIHQRSRVRAC